MTSEERDPWGWVGAETPPDSYQRVWVSPLSYLIPMPSGAVLRWVYVESETLTYSALVRLTEEEAQRVYDSDPASGMLESVRATLHWRGSLLTLSHELGEPYPMWRYRIPSDLSERDFITDLHSPPFEIVEQAVMSAEDRRARMNDLQRRDYAFAAPMLRQKAA